MLKILSAAQKPFSLVGHRGATTNRDHQRIAPENTPPAFQEAHRQGAAIELDVMSTRDGKVVVHHDFKTGRIFALPGQQKEVRKTTWKELQTATFNASAHEQSMNRLLGPNAHYRSAKRFEKLRVPELETVLDSLPDTRFFVELKTISPFSNNRLEAKVARIIREKNLYDRVTVLSFSPLSLRIIKTMDPKIKTALNINVPAVVKKNLALLRGFVNLYAKGLAGVDALQPNYGDTTPELVNLAHKAGLKLVSWVEHETRDEEQARFSELMDMGVDGLITNAVDLLKAEVEKRNS